MGIMKKDRFKKKIHHLEKNLMNALVHPEDGDQRRRYLKRFIYGEAETKQEVAET